MMKPVVVFDVESVGLHGEGFAVGAVVVDLHSGKTLEEFCEAAHPGVADGTKANREWVSEHVMPHLPDRLHSNLPSVRNAFWRFWRDWAETGAVLLADCCWPVEANFLSACVADNQAEREWQGPYPLLDLAPILWAHGVDPKSEFDRAPNELPQHHPLADARQSARLLLEALCGRLTQEEESHEG